MKTEEENTQIKELLRKAFHAGEQFVVDFRDGKHNLQTFRQWYNNNSVEIKQLEKQLDNPKQTEQ